MHVIYTAGALTPQYGGPARSIPVLSAAIKDLGISSEIVHLSSDEGLEELQDVKNVNVSCCSVPYFESRRLRIQWSPWYQKTLFERVRKNEECLIHDNGLWMQHNHVAVRVARKSGVPLVISPRGSLSKWAFRYKSYKKIPAWFVYQKRDINAATVVHATSVQEAKDLRTYGVSNPVVVVPNGIQMPIEIPSQRSSTSDREALFLSRIHPKKGLIMLAQSWAKVRPCGWKILVVGPDEGNHLAQVKAEVEKLGLGREFTFVGEVEGDKKAALYRRASLFILPTFSENFGMVVAEALSHGLPVLTTKGAPWEELVSHRCGWWVDIDVDSLASGLAEATEVSDEKRQEMGTRGRELIEKKYSIRGVAERMKEVYLWMSGKGPSPGCLY
jgi:glycosyltransferase involved in cell wall biosynthesis